MELLKQIKRSVKLCFNSVKLRFVLKSDMLFPLNLNDSVPIFQKRFLIYKFICKCDISYIRRTTQRLDIRIRQHIFSHRHNNTQTPLHSTKQIPPSAIYWIILYAQGHIIIIIIIIIMWRR